MVYKILGLVLIAPGVSVALTGMVFDVKVPLSVIITAMTILGFYLLFK